MDSKSTEKSNPAAAPSHASLSGEVIRPKVQLLYLADLLGFKVIMPEMIVQKKNWFVYLFIVTGSVLWFSQGKSRRILDAGNHVDGTAAIVPRRW